MKRALSLIIALLMLSASFASCSEKPSDETDKPVSETVASAAEPTDESETVETDAEKVTDNLPEKDFGGMDFVIYTREITTHSPFLVEEINGEELNDAIYQRNVSVEDRFKVKFSEEMYSDEGKPYTFITAGDNTYSLMNVRCTAANNIAQKGYAFPLSSLEYIDLTKPYWDESITRDINVGDVNYFAIGDANLVAIDFTNILLFNKDILNNLSLDTSLYTLVDEGKWTFDKYGELGSIATVDLNGDGAFDAEDQYGMLGAAKYMQCSLVQAAGVMYVSKDENNYPVYDMATNEKFISVFEKIFSICNDSGAWYRTNEDANEAPIYHQMFRENKGLFLTTMFFLVESLRDMESDFGIVPFPKYDEAQWEYITRVSFFDTSIIPVTVPDKDCSSIILEALSCESHNVVIPAYYDICLKSKYARDPDSARMIDIILANRVVDFGDTYFQGTIRDGFFSKLFMNNDKTSLVSTASKYQKSTDKIIEKMNKAFMEIEEN